MIAHVALRRTELSGGNWLHAHGWVLGSSTGSGLATSRAECIRKACIEALSAGAAGIALPAMRDYPAALHLAPPPGEPWPPMRLRTHDDPAAVAVALRAASMELMREFIRRRGVPDLRGEASGVIDTLGGPHTVAWVLGCDAAQVVRWGKAGRLPDVRLDALRRDVQELA